MTKFHDEFFKASPDHDELMIKVVSEMGRKRIHDELNLIGYCKNHILKNDWGFVLDGGRERNPEPIQYYVGQVYKQRNQNIVRLLLLLISRFYIFLLALTFHI